MFIEQFEYFTFSCFDCSLDRIESMLISKLVDDKKYGLSRVEPFSFNLYEKNPPKGGAHLKKAYFFSPIINDHIVVMMSNYSDGWATLVNFTSSELKSDAFSFRITNVDNNDSLNSFSCINRGELVRAVYTMKDPKWVYYSEGEVQWFEDKEFYTHKKIKNRLDKNILISYCLKLGFEITNDQFWKSEESILLKQLQQKPLK